MGDPTPRPSPRPGGGGASGRFQPPKPGSTPHLPRPSSTRKIPSPPPGAEIVASHDDAEPSHVRQRVAPGRSPAAGFSLRWKIVGGMAAITVATAVLIFFAVYSKATAQLDDEIDAKGVQIVKTLGSVDPAFWKYAIGSGRGERQKRLEAFLRSLRNLEWAEQRDLIFRATPQVKDLYDQAIDSLGPVTGLSGNAKGVGPGHDVLQITVLDAGPDGGSIQAVPGQGEKGISTYPAAKPSMGGVLIRDGVDKASNQEVRLFSMEKDGGGGSRLKFNVVLSLAKIRDAQASLRSAILLPILLSVVLGVGIAVGLSMLITGPIQALIQDIHEVSSGNLDHQTVPRSKDEVGVLAQTFNRMTEALREAHNQEVEAKALEHDLAIASEIQSNLVPKRMLRIPGYDIGAYYRPSKEVGGDYYDFIEIDEENEGIIVADVSGKGVPGSLVMSMARAFIRMEAERSRNTSPGDTLIRANRMLAPDIKKGMFVTALYCILNKRSHEFRVASAGHNPLAVWRAATNRVELVNPNGMALGFNKGPVFENSIKEERVVLGHGDRIVAYTDGTVEAMNAASEEFGDQRFYGLVKDLAARDSNQMLNLLVKSLDEHKGDAPQSDDITIVTLRYL